MNIAPNQQSVLYHSQTMTMINHRHFGSNKQATAAHKLTTNPIPFSGSKTTGTRQNGRRTRSEAMALARASTIRTTAQVITTRWPLRPPSSKPSSSSNQTITFTIRIIRTIIITTISTTSNYWPLWRRSTRAT